MAYVVKTAIKYINFIDEYGDPRVENWFLVNAVILPIVSISLYYYFIFYIGPNIMKNRSAFNLEKTLIVYNALQIAACTYIVYECWNIIMFKYNLKCQNIIYSPTPDGIRELKVCYFYFLIKAADLLDTVFFILRKKDKQITFLHLYHHGGMCVLTYAITKFYGGGSVLFIPFLNSLVHIFMYAYYLLSVYQKGNKIFWLKKHITQLQLLQFFILMVIIVRVALADNCNIASWAAWVFVVQNLFMISLFTDFYLKTYVYKKKTLTPELNKESDVNIERKLKNLNSFSKNEKQI